MAPVRLHLDSLDDRLAPSASFAFDGTTLTVTTDDADQRVQVRRDGPDLAVTVNGQTTRLPAAGVAQLVVRTGAGNDHIESDLAVPTTVYAGGGRNLIRSGDTAVKQPQPVADPVVPSAATPAIAAPLLAATEVQAVLDRASAASASRDGIVAVVDRNGRILGVRVGDRVSPALTGDPRKLVFAIDGAVAKARTGAFFGNDQAPLTSRTIQNLSQSTVTEREVNSDPNDRDPNSPRRGPGFVAAVGVGGHFPPGVANTPPVDLFGIEHTNRDGSSHVGADHIAGTADDVPLKERFNIDPAFVPAGQELTPPDSYGAQSGRWPGAQSRGIATLPGGVPLVKAGSVVGGVGVFYPGATGFATEENDRQSTTFDPTKPDRTLEAEYVAFVAAGGSAGAGFPFAGPVGDAPALPGFDLPFARIDLVGITLDLFGPGGLEGPETLVRHGQTLGVGNRANGTDLPVLPDGTKYQVGTAVPFGWLVLPHDGAGITAAAVTDIIARGLDQATRTRAAIRSIGNSTRMVFAVTDLNGAVVGLYRMPDATVFSIDVAVAKARNVRYFADAGLLQPQDKVPEVPAGTALTNRTFRYLAQPRFPLGLDGTDPGPFSILRDGGADPLTGRQVGEAKPASAFQTVLAYDAFNPGTNFRDPQNPLNQNGIVFFPGSAPLYAGGSLVGGFGVSGDGVDQDDVVTFAGSQNFGVPASIPRADQIVAAGVRLPYQKFNRNPEGGIPG